MNTVRQYLEKDKERIQSICLGDASPDTDESRYALIMYCNYYIEQEAENCFVAVNEEDEAVGFILCSENYDRFEKIFTELYLPQTATVSLKKYVEAKMSMLSHSMYKAEYPAHFYIKVLPSFQRMGLGSLLISTLKAHLRKKDVQSMMIVCDGENTAQTDFFRKNGFKDLLTSKLGHAMGLEFEEV